MVRAGPVSFKSWKAWSDLGFYSLTYAGADRRSVSKSNKYPVKHFVCTDTKAWKFIWQGPNSKICFLINTPNQMHKTSQMSVVEMSSFLFLDWNMEPVKARLSRIFMFGDKVTYNCGWWGGAGKKSLHKPHLTVVNSFYSGNETWKKYISNHYNNFICEYNFYKYLPDI